MPLLNGKQLQNTSVTLNKMYGTGSLVLQTGAVLQLPTVNIVNPTDVVNKAYVDGVAIGMNVHLACKVATTGTISLTTGTVSPVIDGVTMSYNDRILVWQQSSNPQNGIYVFTGLTAGSSGTFSRSSDMDGSTSFDTPTIGDYTFITNGNTLAGNGYVIVPSGTYSSGLLTPLNVAPVVWSLFTGPGIFTWGNGLNNTGNIINVELAGGGGLTFSATNLTIDSSIAGNGLAWTTGVLSVNVSNGLSIITDTVQVDNSIAGTGLTFSAGILSIKNTAVTPSTYGSTNSVGSVTFNQQGQAIAATAVSIVLNALANINNFTASAITSVLAAANFTDTATIDLTANSSTVNANIIVGSITASLLNATAFTSSMSGYLVSVTATGSFAYVPTGGGVTSVIGGTGISVNGTTVATVSIANTGVVAAQYGSTNSVSQVTFNLQGQATSATSVSIVLNALSNINNFTASAITSVLASANFTDTATIDLTANGSTVNAAIIVGSITASLLMANGGATAGLVLSAGPTGSFNWISSTTGAIVSVNSGTGISVNTSAGSGNATVSIANTGVVAAQYGSTNSVSQVTFNLQGQATSATSVSIVLNALANINNFTASAITSVLASANFTDTATIDLTANGSTVNANIIVGSITASLLNATAFTSSMSGYLVSVTATGSFAYVPTGGGVTSVIGGTGISVNGTTVATVSIANTGVVAAQYGSTNSVSQVTFNLQGQATSATSVSIVLNALSNINNFTASAITSVLASANFTDTATIDLTANGSTVNAAIIVGSITASLLMANGGATAGLVLSAGPTGSFNWISSTTGAIVSVNSGTGISVNTSAGSGNATVSINNTGVVAAQYGSTNSVSQVTFNLQGQATSATSVSIVLNALANINNFTASAITSVLAAANFTDTATIDLTANSSTVNANIIVNSITASLLNTNSGGATAGYVLSVGSTGSFLWVPNTVGSITAVNGGTGISVLTSAGSGNATVSIANTGVVAAQYGSTNSVSQVTFNLQGQATSATSVSIVLNALANINNFTASAITSVLASANFVDSATIDFTANSSTVTAVIVPGSITASLLSVQSGGATAGYFLSVSATGSFIWSPSSAVVGTPLYTQRNVTPAATTGNGSSTGITLTFTPDPDINVSVYLNGQLMFLGNGVTNSVDCYFGTSPIAAVAIASLVATNTLYWNGTYIGYDLDTNDRIDILYNK